MKTVRLIVLNYNRRDLLERFMPSVAQAAKHSRYPCSVTLLDNASTDDSVAFVQKNFLDVAIFRAPENLVLCSYNACVKELSEDIVVLLNNDMELEPGFVDPLMRYFEEDPDTFFVATHGDKALADWRWGVLSARIDYPGFQGAIETPGLSLSAGVAAFDRRKYLLLGGYDALYLPGRYEDVDLCYRGWKRGWKGYYAPLSRKQHVGGASFEKTFDAVTTQSMVCRNGILFMMKNITDPLIKARFAFGLASRLAWALLSLQFYVWRGFFGALSRYGQARRSATAARKDFRLSDREVIRRIGAGIP